MKLWDLRKLRNFKTISLDDKYTVRGLTFDNSGHYLAVAGPDVRVYQIRFAFIAFPFRPLHTLQNVLNDCKRLKV